MNLLLLAQQVGTDASLAALRDSLRKKGDFADRGQIAGIGFIAAIAIAAIVLIWAVYKLRPAKRTIVGAPPKRLFVQAAKSLGIGFIDRLILLRAACAAGIDHPVMLFLTRELMEQHAGNWADEFPVWSLRSTIRRRVDQIQQQIFGTPVDGSLPEPLLT